MRVIKFRAKDKRSGKWVFGSYIHTISVTTGKDIYRIIPKTVKTTDDEPPRLYAGDYEVIYGTVGQFTGLKDKHGNEIYEGDILQIFDNYHAQMAKGYRMVVFSYEYVGGWIVVDKICNIKNGLSIALHTDIISIAGNVHDNPELLNEK